MAEQSATTSTQDQMTLRRRARRRLVGAIAIALATVLILPMLFDPEPRPLGPDVDIRIPMPSTPFEPLPAAVPVPPVPGHRVTTANEPTPQVAEPTLPVAVKAMPVVTATHSEKQTKPEPADQPADLQPSVEKTAVKVGGGKAGVQVGVVGVKSGEASAGERPDVKAKPLPAPSGAFASHGYYLQLGAFGNAENARQLREKAEAAGFKVDLLASNGQFRVRVGPFPEREHAQDVHARLKAHGFNSVMIGP